MLRRLSLVSRSFLTPSQSSAAPRDPCHTPERQGPPHHPLRLLPLRLGLRAGVRLPARRERQRNQHCRRAEGGPEARHRRPEPRQRALHCRQDPRRQHATARHHGLRQGHCERHGDDSQRRRAARRRPCRGRSRVGGGGAQGRVDVLGLRRRPDVRGHDNWRRGHRGHVVGVHGGDASARGAVVH